MKVFEIYDHTLPETAKPNVAILLATYNGKKFISRQLDTILNQEGVNTTIFVSDDCSTDRTLEVLSEYELAHSNIILVSSGVRFGTAAGNFLNLIQSVDLSSFSYVAFADQDDIWMSKKLRSAISLITQTESSAHSSNFIAFWEGSGKATVVKKNFPLTTVDHWFEGPGPGCSQVFKVDAFTSFQKFVRENWELIQNIHYHDWLVYAYFRHNKHKWIISDQTDFYYVQHGQNEIGVNSGLSALKHRLKLLWSGWYKKQVNLIYFAVTGKSEDLCSRSFILRHAFSCRRKRSHAIFLSFCVLMGII